MGGAVPGLCNLAQGLYPVGPVRDQLNSSVSIFEHPGPSWKKIGLDQRTTTDRICIGQSKIVRTTNWLLLLNPSL